MWTFVLGPADLDEAARRVTRRWGWCVTAGVVVIVIGLLLLFNIVDAAATLALLVAFALAIEGVDEIVNAPRYQARWPGYLLGALYLATAVVAVIWPDITLWALAVVVGLGFIVTGVVQLGALFRFHHDLPYRWVFVAAAVVTLLAGVLAIAWPGATVFVLCVILGLRVIMAGAGLLLFGLGLREANKLLAR